MRPFELSVFGFVVWLAARLRLAAAHPLRVPDSHRICVDEAFVRGGIL